MLENVNSMCNKKKIIHCLWEARHNRAPENNGLWNKNAGFRVRKCRFQFCYQSSLFLLFLPDFLLHNFPVHFIEYLLFARHCLLVEGWDCASVKGFADKPGGGIRDLLACSAGAKEYHYPSLKKPGVTPLSLPLTGSHNVELPKQDPTQLIASQCLQF